MIKVLEEGSIKLSELGVAFLNFLRSRGESKEPGSKVEVVCFFEEYPTSIGVVYRRSSFVDGFHAEYLADRYQNVRHDCWIWIPVHSSRPLGDV